MKRKLWTIVGLLTVCSLAGSNALAAGSIAKGKLKAVVCTACHGAKGRAVDPLRPHLAGQTAGYIVKQLKDFSSGKRTDKLMSAQAKDLTESDMEDVAAYFASLTPKKGVVNDKSLAKLGERIYSAGNSGTTTAACVACHGPVGEGIPPRIPRVATQSAAYSIKQLMAFKKGVRTNDNRIMEDIAFSMSLKQIKAVSEYMQGL